MKNGFYPELENEIQSLPQGGITYKTINGKRYAYYQWRENGKQHSRRVKDDEFEILSKQIERRKQLQMMEKRVQVFVNNEYKCYALVDDALDRWIENVKMWKRREIYSQIHDYIFDDCSEKVFILFGLRRTGKTTMIRQVISEMNSDMRKQTAFIQVDQYLSLADINHDMKILAEKGYRYVFIDEATHMHDFIDGAALFSDIYAASGMKIVLSGTDSLGFSLTEHEELFDRCIMCHTTYISYREFENVLGITGIDQYIRYGGTMSISGAGYQNDLFSDEKKRNEYVNEAIACNIQHSLKNYQNEGHFRALRELYEKDELTSAINRIVEDINHRFTIDVLTKPFRSNDLQISAKNLRKDRKQPTDILDRIDTETVTTILKNELDILNRNEQSVEIRDVHRIEIREYLYLLDLIEDIEVRWLNELNRHDNRTVFTQPGLRYCQAEALVRALMQDHAFRELSLSERNRVTERILNEIRGRMMEDIVLLETKHARRNCEVFHLQFAIGEFDMVVFDEKNESCQIYEIKHSSEAVLEQCRYLLDEQKCRETEFRYGTITGKYVIYRGEDMFVNGIQYLNVEKYLLNL